MNYIAVTKFGAKWVDDKTICQTVFSKASVKLALNYLVR